MKIIPIKVEKALTMNHKFIEWKLHNVCNNDCSFCGDEHKDGSKYWFDIDTYKKYTDKLVKICEGNPFWIQLTGGEPTLYPKFIELLEYIHKAGGYTSLISNGVRSIRWWKELRDTKALDVLILSFHSEQTSDYKHIADIANLFHDEPVKVMCLMTHTKDSINLAFEALDYLKENTGAIVSIKAMNIGDYDINSYYTEDQLQRLKNPTFIGKIPGKKKSRIPEIYDINHKLKVYYNDDTVKFQDPQLLLRQKLNKFDGWLCDIGQDNMRIDREIVYRGVCGVGGERHMDDQDLNFMNDSITCNVPECYCGTDMIANKSLPKFK